MSNAREMVEDSGMIYYMDRKGMIQDGNDWLDDLKHGVIDMAYVETLKECYWSGSKQTWVKEGSN